MRSKTEGKRRFSKTLSRVEVFENGGSASLSVDGRKRRFRVFVWTGEKGGFRKRLRHWPWHVPVKKNQKDVFLSVFGGQVWTVENAAKTLVWTKNFLSVFKKQKTEVFENALVWTWPETKMSAHYKPSNEPKVDHQRLVFYLRTR